MTCVCMVVAKASVTGSSLSGQRVPRIRYPVLSILESKARKRSYRQVRAMARVEREEEGDMVHTMMTERFRVGECRVGINICRFAATHKVSLTSNSQDTWPRSLHYLSRLEG